MTGLFHESNVISTPEIKHKPQKLFGTFCVTSRFGSHSVEGSACAWGDPGKNNIDVMPAVKYPRQNFIIARKRKNERVNSGLVHRESFEPKWMRFLFKTRPVHRALIAEISEPTLTFDLRGKLIAGPFFKLQWNKNLPGEIREFTNSFGYSGLGERFIIGFVILC